MVWFPYRSLSRASMANICLVRSTSHTCKSEAKRCVVETGSVLQFVEITPPNHRIAGTTMGLKHRCLPDAVKQGKFDANWQLVQLIFLEQEDCKGVTSGSTGERRQIRWIGN